ncbi:hypothetical protein DPEC_G00026730 [Dallia pectoralis]|uniref:Uncharacterized protein n=1 Tax=Dallia pectoralis TaxID=75939 RepID=A0ACC2HIC9_DALPE|nr:hypothetical protein DPEC_G00026730 [Dallia pectoralis]
MDFLNQNYLSGRNPYDYTFNFWNDYLGLSTLVTKNHHTHMMPHSPNSITESLKATLGLDDSPACACVISGGGGGEGGGHLDCCCPSASPPPASILDLKERFSILRPFHNQIGGGVPLHDRDSGFGSGFTGFDLFGVERKMRNKPAPRNKQEPKICVFCRNNGAPEEVYGSHVLKTPDARVVCPILRAYTCPLCSANGDNAHTIKYCPLSKDQPAQRPLKGGRAMGEGELSSSSRHESHSQLDEQSPLVALSTCPLFMKAVHSGMSKPLAHQINTGRVRAKVYGITVHCPLHLTISGVAAPVG